MTEKSTQTAMARLVTAYENTLAAHLPPGATVCIALSGGMDSSVLLHVALQRRQQWRVTACHVNHGISRRAPQWEEFCRHLCAEAEVPLTVKCATPPSANGGSEEWARAMRLQAFAQLSADAVIAAHHANDQAETVLFRLLRGSGVHGIAAMDTRATPAGVDILRPWLNIERCLIAAYAMEQRLHWVEDEDNSNLSRRRNFLRWRGLPMLTQGFEDCNAMLAAAGRRMREGSELLLQLAEQDEQAARQTDGGLQAAYFCSLGEARIRNWLYRSLVLRRQRFSERLISEAARQIMNHQQAKHTCFYFKEFSLRCWRGALYWQQELPPLPADFSCPITVAAGTTELPALGGRLVLAPTLRGGLAPDKIGAVLQLRLRQGGERLTPPGRHTRSVANLLQEAAIFPWRRQQLPFLFAGASGVSAGKLAAVAGVALAAEFCNTPEHPGLSCHFEWD
ncbi:MAG: tRNA lysidine(34) synthetase TilS [Proteobacteria bacterium]|nr:tRNA lysidine(34) synthetase TilS [Pseudomonadota bacterium]